MKFKFLKLIFVMLLPNIEISLCPFLSNTKKKLIKSKEKFQIQKIFKNKILKEKILCHKKDRLVKWKGKN